jgi:hypothetical protein
VSERLEAQKAAPPAPTIPRISCVSCGGSLTVIALLDSRNGQSHSMFKCGHCSEISWRQNR